MKLSQNSNIICEYIYDFFTTSYSYSDTYRKWCHTTGRGGAQTSVFGCCTDESKCVQKKKQREREQEVTAVKRNPGGVREKRGRDVFTNTDVRPAPTPPHAPSSTPPTHCIDG